MKICSKCKYPFPATADFFPIRKREFNFDLRECCFECYNIKKKEIVEKYSKEKSCEASKKYYASHPQYYQKNRKTEKVKESRKLQKKRYVEKVTKAYLFRKLPLDLIPDEMYQFNKQLLITNRLIHEKLQGFNKKTDVSI